MAAVFKKKQFSAIAGRIFAVSDDNEAEIISWTIIDTNDLSL